MALETFLTNRPRKRKASTRKRRRGGGLPSALLSRMIRTHGIKKGMKEAWKAHRSGARNPRAKLPVSYHRKTAKHRPVVYSGIRKGSYVRSPYSRSPQINPFGEEVMIVGNKPRKRKRVVRHRRKKSYLRNPSPKRRLYASRHVTHRKRRRNPARSGVPAISYRRPMSLIMPAASVAGGIFAADYLPAMIGMAGSPLTRLGVKIAVGFAGAMILRGKNGALFAAGAGANALMDVVKTYVFKNGTTTAGFGAFTRPQLGAFTRPITPFQGVQRFPS